MESIHDWKRRVLRISVKWKCAKCGTENMAILRFLRDSVTHEGHGYLCIPCHEVWVKFLEKYYRRKLKKPDLSVIKKDQDYTVDFSTIIEFKQVFKLFTTGKMGAFVFRWLTQLR